VAEAEVAEAGVAEAGVAEAELEREEALIPRLELAGASDSTKHTKSIRDSS
jgi:hypothetical protein